jgi:hypothetical protein
MMAQPAAGRDITAGQSNRVSPTPDTAAATRNKIAHEIAAEHAPLRPGSVIKLQHVETGYTLPPAFLVGSPAQEEQGMPDDEGSADVTFKVHGALGDEDSDGGYRQHPRRDHAEKDLPHGPPPPGHRYLRALPGGVADWNGNDGSSYAKRAARFVPFYHTPHLGPPDAYAQRHATPHEQIIVSLRGRLLADEDYDNREQPLLVKQQQRNMATTPDFGRYLGVKGPDHILVSNAGIGPDSRFRVLAVDPKTHRPQHAEPAVGGRLRQEAARGGG